MKITAEMLTAAIEEAGNWNLPHELAERLLPFIERHIAAGQPKPAGNAIDGLLATARPFLAEEMLLKQGYTWSGSGWVAPVPKPAGAVPLPSTAPYVKRLCRIFRDHPYDDTSAIVLHDYAREAAGRSVSVGTQIIGWIYEDTLPEGYPYDAMFEHSKVDGVRMFPVFAPTPQQPAAEGAAVNQSLTTEGAGREAVATVIGFDPWDRVAVEWHARDIPPGTKLYTGPTPAADAGGVTDAYAELLAADVEYDEALIKALPTWPHSVNRWEAAKARRAAAIAALTPEVSHGE